MHIHGPFFPAADYVGIAQMNLPVLYQKPCICAAFSLIFGRIAMNPSIESCFFQPQHSTQNTWCFSSKLLSTQGCYNGSLRKQVSPEHCTHPFLIHLMLVKRWRSSLLQLLRKCFLCCINREQTDQWWIDLFFEKVWEVFICFDMFYFEGMYGI